MIELQMPFIQNVEREGLSLDKIEYHPIERGGCLGGAKILFENRGLRNVVSRAYYAMSHAARALLLTENIPLRTHRGLTSEEYSKLGGDA
jgi:uncharacterized protein (UPF0332 family)